MVIVIDMDLGCWCVVARGCSVARGACVLIRSEVDTSIHGINFGEHCY